MSRDCNLTRTDSAAFALICLCAIIWPQSASAYRPFDGTDAAVADPKEVEIEFQPIGRLKDGADKSLVTPATVLNIGLENRWEAVFEGNGLIPLSPSGPMELTDAGIFLKHVLRPGSLQDQTGPSIATEFGMLMPGVNADQGVGARLAGIASQRWDWGTVHFNAAISRSRDQNTDVFAGLIIEGPSKWPIRPVAEVFYGEEINRSHTISCLLGLIWQVRDNLSFDVAVRHAITDGHSVDEIRVGTTFGFSLGPMIAARR